MSFFKLFSAIFIINGLCIFQKSRADFSDCTDLFVLLKNIFDFIKLKCSSYAQCIKLTIN